MKLLLDTHVLLWALSSPDRLSEKSRAIISDPRNAVFVSAASSWEIEIKRALGKLKAPLDLDRQVTERRFLELPIRLRHARALAELPPLHRDPFDRMLIAQAMVEELILLSSDEPIFSYSIRALRA